MRSLIVDCSGEAGDLRALHMVLDASTQLKLLGVTTTESGAQAIRARFERPPPLFSGCPGTFASPFSKKDAPPPTPHGVIFLVQTLLQTSEKITLVALGRLTNIALAIIYEPRIRQNIQEIIIVGGAIGEGDATPAAERHFHADPFSASIVLSSRVPLTLLTRDLAPDMANRAPLAIIYLLNPSLFKDPKEVSVSVMCEEGLLRGHTCIDLWGKLDLRPHATVFEGIDFQTDPLPLDADMTLCAA